MNNAIRAKTRLLNVTQQSGRLDEVRASLFRIEEHPVVFCARFPRPARPNTTKTHGHPYRTCRSGTPGTMGQVEKCKACDWKIRMENRVLSHALLGDMYDHFARKSYTRLARLRQYALGFVAMRVCRNVTFQHAKRPMKDDVANQRLGPVNQSTTVFLSKTTTEDSPKICKIFISLHLRRWGEPGL